ncbi:SelB domain-containing protein [Microtetraspora malaysiensis]|uniref:SelB domain-containing protein n=1 Tax=Microtetraspora malaysiensis TaxID=161358 RepID=UPI00082A7A02|nr:SelB C-terminal domain-containing protein [Microtetraspora malaysiensis]
MRVIATAGHVDHGKSSLLRALTGMEPDRWAEERRRGLTIDLGFVWTGTPEMAFVDVPGHERFVTNMLTGVAAVPAVLFVVAADGGWQAQSQEHLEVIDALGIRHGVLAVTRSDLADPEPAMREAAGRLARSSLGPVESVAVSAVTGQGLSGLREALGRLAAAIPAGEPDADVRLWVDRAFTVDGRGVVVTGTLGAGTIRVSDTFEATRAGEPVYVRGLHSLQVARQELAGPARVAVNLRGRAASGLRRGDALVTPGRWLAVEETDVRLTGRPEPERPLPERLVWHIGSAAVPARIRPLSQDSARITLARPLPLRLGDRALLRDPGSGAICGVTVLDVRPPALRRRGAARERATELAQFDGVPDGAAELRRRGLVRRDELLAMGAAPPGPPVAGDWLADPAHWSALRERLVRLVAEHTAASPSDPGLGAEELRQALDLPDRALVTALAEGTALHRVRGRLAAAPAVLAAPLRTAVAVVRSELDRSPFRAPDADRLTALGLDTAALAAAEQAGELVRLAPGVVLLPDAPGKAVSVLAGLPQPFTAAEAREALSTSRRVAIPLLEYLDRAGRTRRVDDTHRVIIR